MKEAPQKQSWFAEGTAATLGGIAAMPAVAGLALASGLPLRSAVISALVGTGIVSLFSRHRFQFHGPATSLILSSLLAVKAGGMVGLALTVALCGLIQVAGGIARVGWWVHILPPRVVSGLMGGIGALVVYKQFELIARQATEPKSIALALAFLGGTVAVTALWPVLTKKFGATWLKRIPGAAVALAVAAFAWWLLHAEAPTSVDHRIDLFALPEYWQGLNAFNPDWHLLALAASLALLSGSKALVVSAGLHRQDLDMKVDFNRELIVVGLGNVVAGICGGLPLTAHLDRSQFTRDVGGKSRASTVLQGVCIAAILGFAPGFLAAVPVEAFAGILVYSGSKLIDWRFFRKVLSRQRVEERWLLLGTFATTIVLNLTAGVLVGLLLGMFRLAQKFAATAEIRVARAEGRDDLVVFFLKGAFTFVCLRRLVEVARDIDPGAVVVLETKEVYYIDHACLSFFEELRANQQAGGGTLVFDPAELTKKAAMPLNLRTEVLKELKGMDRRKSRRSENVGRRRMDYILAEVEAATAAVPEKKDEAPAPERTKLKSAG